MINKFAHLLSCWSPKVAVQKIAIQISVKLKVGNGIHSGLGPVRGRVPFSIFATI